MWVKVTNSRRLAKSHGFYLQHAKEACTRLASLRRRCMCLLSAGAAHHAIVHVPERW